MQILFSMKGWYLLFSDAQAPHRAKTIMENTIVQGRRLTLIVESPSAAPKSIERAENTKAGDDDWRFLRIAKKNRPVPVAKKLLPTRRSPSPRKSEADHASTSETEEDVAPARRKRAISYSSSSELSDDDALAVRSDSKKPRDTPASGDEASTVLPRIAPSPSSISTPSEIAQSIDPAKPVKKRAAKPKTAKGAKKAKVVEEITPFTIEHEAPEIAEIRLDHKSILPPAIKQVKSKKPAKSQLDKLVASGDLADDEDAYWLGKALAAERDGFEPDFSDEEEEADEKHPLFHASGAWRAEGWRKIPQIQKSAYLPERNRAAVSIEDASALTSGRTARVSGRRLAQDIELSRKTAATAITGDSDLFAFNQLRIRKKQLRFARSAIEGYGLYAAETIQTGEMICEYVGEICRSSVAEIREQRYLKQGIGSSYLFRIDGDSVCDATFRGSVR